MAGVHPLADLAPRDVVARAITQPHARPRPRPPLARRDDDRRLPAPLPDDLARRARPPASTRRATGCRSRRPRTTCRAASSPTSTARRRCRASGRAARPRAAACTARTGSRRTRCSTVSCSAPRVVDAIVAGKDGPEPTGAMRGVLDVPTPTPTSRPTRSCCRRTPIDRRRAASAVAARDVGRLRRRARRRRAALARESLADLARRRRRLVPPAGRRRTRSRNLVAVARAIVAARDARARSRAGTHTRARLSRALDACSARSSCVQRPATRRASSRCPTAVTRGAASMSDFDPPRTVVRDVVARALAEDLGLLGDLTSIACIRDDADRGRPRSSPAPRACSPAPRSSTETFRQVDPTRRRCSGSVARRRRGRGRHASSARSSGSLRSILTGERVALNFLCHCSGVAIADPPLRARGARARRASSTPARRCPGCARVRAGRGARRRRLQPPRLALRRGAHQGQPPRRARPRAGGRAGPRALAGPDRSRSSATRSTRSPRRATAGADLVLLDNMTPDAGARGGRARSTARSPGRGVGRRHARDRRRVRRDRRRLHLGRRAHALGAACSTSVSTSR